MWLRTEVYVVACRVNTINASIGVKLIDTIYGIDGVVRDICHLLLCRTRIPTVARLRPSIVNIQNNIHITMVRTDIDFYFRRLIPFYDAQSGQIILAVTETGVFWPDINFYIRGVSGQDVRVLSRNNIQGIVTADKEIDNICGSVRHDTPVPSEVYQTFLLDSMKGITLETTYSY